MPITITDKNRALWDGALVAGDKIIPVQELPEVTERIGSSGPYLRVNVPLHPDGVITYKDPESLDPVRLEQVALSHLAVVAEVRKRQAEKHEADQREARRKQVKDDIALLHRTIGGVLPGNIPALRTAFGEVDAQKAYEMHDAWSRLKKALDAGSSFEIVEGAK